MIYENSDEGFENGEWMINEAICPDRFIEYNAAQSFARGIFHCTRISGDGEDQVAVMKIYMQ